MDLHPDQLALDALALVVTFGIGFLLWTLTHLFRETRPESDGRLFKSTPARH
jgi:hypothetical protein